MRTLLVLLVTGLVFVSGTMCSPSEPNRLDGLGKFRMDIKGQTVELWIANTFDEQSKGLMFVTAEEMAPLSDGTERGMLFVFDFSGRDSFWMKNTIIPLDIAYISAAGVVVSTYTMTPLDDRHNQYPPAALYRYAIELNAGLWERLGVKPGDTIQIPAEALKASR